MKRVRALCTLIEVMPVLMGCASVEVVLVLMGGACVYGLCLC